MAVFKKINQDISYREEYLVEGELSEEDILWINNIKYNRVKLRFLNTVNLNSRVLSRINNDNVVFSIDGEDYNQLFDEIIESKKVL